MNKNKYLVGLRCLRDFPGFNARNPVIRTKITLTERFLTIFIKKKSKKLKNILYDKQKHKHYLFKL